MFVVEAWSFIWNGEDGNIWFYLKKCFSILKSTLHETVSSCSDGETVRSVRSVRSVGFFGVEKKCLQQKKKSVKLVRMHFCW